MWFYRLKNERLHNKCNKCKKGLLTLLSGLNKKFPNTYKLFNGDINKFILLLRRSFYPYKYMDSFERFNESILPNKKAFYSKLNLENITDKDYIHAKKVFKEFKIKKLGQYHYLYVQNNTLLISDVFES